MTRHQPPFQVAIRNLLQAGFGTEDIAIMLECGIDRVRFEVRRLRTTGELLRVLGVKAPPVKTRP